MTLLPRPSDYRRLQHVACGGFWVLSLSGCAISIWAHLVSMFGQDPDLVVRDFWLVQMVLSGLLVPIVVELFRTRDHAKLTRAPRWMKRLIYVLLAYYGANFYGFLYWSANHVRSSVTWRMLTSGWLVLFAASAVFYWVRFAESRSV